MQNDQNVDKPGINDINHTGVVAKIIYNMVGQTFHKVKLLGIVRCKLLEFVDTEPFWNASIVTVPIVNDDMDKELAYVRLLIEELQSDSYKIFEGFPNWQTSFPRGLPPTNLPMSWRIIFRLTCIRS